MDLMILIAKNAANDCFLFFNRSIKKIPLLIYDIVRCYFLFSYLLNEY